MKLNMYKFTGDTTEGCRPTLNGVYHDNGWAVASDAMILVASKAEYDAGYEGRVIDKKGMDITGLSKNGYPNWRRFMPLKYDKAFPIERLMESVDIATEYIKKAPKFTEDRKRIKRKVYVLVGVDGEVFAFDYNRAKMFLSLPKKGAEVLCQDSRRPVWYRNSEEGCEALLMPALQTSSDRAIVKYAIENKVYDAQDKAGYKEPTVYVYS